MKTPTWPRFLVLFLCVGATSTAQTNTKTTRISDSPEEMQKLLAETAATYREAKSFRIEREIVGVTRGEFITSSNRTWEKKAVAPGYRYRTEVKDDWGWSVVQSDGSTEWNWYPWRNQYSEQPVDRSADPDGRNPGDGGFVTWLEQIDKKLASGKVQPPQTILVGTRRLNCVVIIGPPPARQQPDPSLKEEHTYWIDRKRRVLVQEQWVTRSMVPEHRFSTVQTITYTRNEFDTSIPNSLFTFSPKPGIERVEKFDFGPIKLAGKIAPPLNLKTLDGKNFDLESLRGKPVLVDFWATWCLPCRESMPVLAKLHDEFQDKLGLVSVSKDDDPEDATRFVAKHRYSWVQLSDPQLETDKRWGSSGIPRILLVGKDGKVLLEMEGLDAMEQAKMRAALHKMDSSFPDVFGGND